MVQAIDHVVVAVRDLARASEDYQNLGFTVTPGGEHTGGATHNALISFADGSYFELIAFAEPDRRQEHRWWEKFSRGEGTVDFALAAASLADEAARLRQAGLDVDGPHDGGRARPDGVRIAWKMLNIASDDAPLPFVIEDVTARELRVPPGDATQHPLGVSGIAGVTVLVSDLDRASGVYQALLGSRGEATSPSVEGARRARHFPFGPHGHWIKLVEPDAGAEALQAHLRVRDIAPYEVVLAGDVAKAGLLPLELTHGARLRLG